MSRITTRLCLDHLKSARVRRETYVGQWLPEPVVHAAGFTETPGGDLAQDISYALMLALERLSPLERAAFLLHDVFGLPFPEIAETLQRSTATCRQLAARARANLRTARPRFAVASAESERIAAMFMQAAQSGDVTGLRRVLAADAVLHSDGGGKVRAVLRPIVGVERIARLFAGLAHKGWPPRSFVAVRINGLPGFVVHTPTGITDTYAFEVREQSIRAVYVVRNPDKLRHLRAAGIAGNN
ncbi:MAG: RNA polymerase sigma factor SigJ [Verrucomicrobia bacterium]|nr:RNA polymerase sigma factor SigJ [Verrucomicrobiota bacterium]